MVTIPNKTRNEKPLVAGTLMNARFPFTVGSMSPGTGHSLSVFFRQGVAAEIVLY
jgi:hypothetical protein